MKALGQALLRVQELEAETSDQGAELAELRDYQAKAEATAQTAFGQQMDSLKQVSLPFMGGATCCIHFDQQMDLLILSAVGPVMCRHLWTGRQMLRQTGPAQP